MDEFKAEKWVLEDGRRAERRVTEQASENGESERVVEFHVEDKRPLKLQQRIVEKSKPIVFERLIETIDTETGSITEKKIESIEPKVKMQLVDHIAVGNQPEEFVSFQSVPTTPSITREEMVETIVAAIKATKEVSAQSVRPVSELSNKIASLGLADEISKSMPVNLDTDSDLVKTFIIVLELAVLAYIIYFM